MVGLLQSKQGEHEEMYSKARSLCTTGKIKDREKTERIENSSFLSSFDTSSTRSVDEIYRYSIHELLTTSFSSFESAVSKIEQSLLKSNPTPLTPTDRSLIEVQLRQISTIRQSTLCLLPVVLSSLTMESWIWDASEEEIIRKCFSEMNKRAASSSGSTDKMASSVTTEESKPKRQRKTTSKQAKEKAKRKVLRELTLTIPNHPLRYEGYLLTQEYIDRIDINKNLFGEYRKLVAEGAME